MEQQKILGWMGVILEMDFREAADKAIEIVCVSVVRWWSQCRGFGVGEFVRNGHTQKTASWGAAHDLFYFLIAASYSRFFIATILHHLPITPNYSSISMSIVVNKTTSCIVEIDFFYRIDRVGGVGGLGGLGGLGMIGGVEGWDGVGAKRMRAWARKIKWVWWNLCTQKTAPRGTVLVRPKFLIGNKKAVHRTTYVYQLLMSDGNTCRLPGQGHGRKTYCWSLYYTMIWQTLNDLKKPRMIP